MTTRRTVPRTAAMIVTGLWGEIADPEAAIAGIHATHEQLHAASGTTSTVSEPERVTPDGLGDAIMECRMFDLGEGSAEGQNGLAPMCMWADGSSVGTTIFDRFPAADAAGAPADVTIEEAAAHAAQIRDDAMTRGG